MRLTFGLEPDVWSDDPPPTEVVVSRRLSDGSLSEHSRRDAPVSDFALGGGGAAAYEVEVLTAEGASVARTRSVEVRPRDFVGASVPLFIGRTDALARAASLGPHGAAPPVAVVADRYLFVAGARDGEHVRTDLFDLATWQPVGDAPELSCPESPCVYRSLAVIGDDDNIVLGIGEGWGVWLNLGTLGSGVAELPMGLSSFADVAGGATVSAPDGVEYVVGATREDSPTDRVLQVSPSGDLTTLQLETPRAGAAAAWIDGFGLLVAGGSATGAGAELLAIDAARFVALPFPSDDSTGAALADRGSGIALRVGGVDGSGAPAASVELDVACDAACSPADTGAAIIVQNARAFASPERVVAIGDGASGTVVRFVDGRETAPRDDRSRATAVALPTGHVAVVSGVDPAGQPVATLELLSP